MEADRRPCVEDSILYYTLLYSTLLYYSTPTKPSRSLDAAYTQDAAARFLVESLLGPRQHTRGAQYGLIKEYGLNYIGIHNMI